MSIPNGWTETGDCMILLPGAERTIPGKTYEDPYHQDMAIDENGARYVVTEDGDDTVFTPENEWEPGGDCPGGDYGGDGVFARNH